MHQFGYEFDHQTGSHMVLRRDRAPFRHLSVPDHRELGTGLLRRLIREAGLTVEEFKAAL
jgi:predicted RNA binding protein YcfA (HicA-like mRNA interferase family)